MIFLEHVTAVTVSIKDKLTLSLGVAVGSSIVRYNCSSECLVGLITILDSKSLSSLFRE